jgi:hypothetical protein
MRVEPTRVRVESSRMRVAVQSVDSTRMRAIFFLTGPRHVAAAYCY